jgi:hypothetical protein
MDGGGHLRIVLPGTVAQGQNGGHRPCQTPPGPPGHEDFDDEATCLESAQPDSASLEVVVVVGCGNMIISVATTSKPAIS